MFGMFTDNIVDLTEAGLVLKKNVHAKCCFTNKMVLNQETHSFGNQRVGRGICPRPEGFARINDGLRNKQKHQNHSSTQLSKPPVA